MLVLVLAGVWALVLVPPALRARNEGKSGDSIHSFDRQLAVLGRTGGFSSGMRSAPALSMRLPGAPLAVRSGLSSAARQRRRDILVGLLAAMGATFVLGLLPPLRILWTFNVLIDLVFAGYVYLLLQRRSLTLQTGRTVRYLPNQMPDLSSSHADATNVELDLRESVYS